MSPLVWGVLLGGMGGLGLAIVVRRLLILRRPQLNLRVLPYLRDVRPAEVRATSTLGEGRPLAVASEVFGPLLKSAADMVERVLGGGSSVRRRLTRSGSSMTLHEFRIQQVLWGLAGFGAVAAFQLLRSLSGGVGPISALVGCIGAFAGGVVMRDYRLSSDVATREREMLQEFPAVAELLALAVAAGESPVAALERVTKRCQGELSVELSRVLARIRTGQPVTDAFHEMATSTGLPLVSRFATGISVAVERGTPLADVLHAQAADVREAGRRELIETAARKEVAMMAPVVFLVLPVTILFAFFPGLIGLRLTAQ